MAKNKWRIYSCDGWATRIQQTKISLTFDFLSQAWRMSLTFCLLFCLLMWDILSDSVHRISVIITYFLHRVKLSLTGDFLVRNTQSRQKMDIFFASTESLTGGRTILTQVPDKQCSCSTACWQIPVTGSPTCPTAAWASFWQMLVSTCGWGTAGETPGLGNTRRFRFLRMNSGPSGIFELIMTGVYFLSTLNTDTWQGKQMDNSRSCERGN